MAAILNIRQKHKIARISLKVRDRAISSNFSTTRVHLPDTLPKVQKIFGFRKMAAILNFRQEHKIAHISLTVRDRAISSKFSTPRVHLQDTQTQNCLYLVNGAR